MFIKGAAPRTGGTAESRMVQPADALVEPLDEPDEAHDGGLDLYDIDAEF